MPNKPKEGSGSPHTSDQDGRPSGSDAELQRVLDFFRQAAAGEATVIDHKAVGGDDKRVNGVSLQMLDRSYNSLPQLESEAEYVFREITNAIVEGLRQSSSIIIAGETFGVLMMLAEEKGLKSPLELVAAFLLKPVAAVPRPSKEFLIFTLTQQQTEEHMRRLGLSQLDVLLPTTDIKH